MLLDFPLDILKLIFDLIPNRSDLSNLAEAVDESPEDLRDFLNSYLFKELVLATSVPANEDSQKLHDITVQPQLPQFETPERCFRHVRALKIETPNLSYPCNHGPVEPKGLDDFLTLFEDERFLSFSWEMGRCAYPFLFGPEGYLSRKQTSLKRLSLRTAKSCIPHYENQGNVDLSAFESLTHLLWNGVTTNSDFRALARALRANSRTLLSLRIGVIYSLYPRIYGEICDIDSLFPLLLGILPGEAPHNVPLELPVLQTLSLSQMFLKEEHIAGITRVLDFSQLRSFDATHCLGIEILLQKVVESRRPIRLESLTIQEYEFDVHAPYGEIEEALKTFLRAFTSLKRLHLCLIHDFCVNDIIEAATGHRKTLTHFVYHCTNTEPGEFGTRNQHDLPLVMNLSPLEHPLEPLGLECLALCADTPSLDTAVRPFTTKDTLKILHIRNDEMLHGIFGLTAEDRTKQFDPEKHIYWMQEMDLRVAVEGYDGYRNPALHFDVDAKKAPKESLGERAKLHEFANWAFGPTGIRSLQLICLSESPSEDRTYMNALLLCRNKRPRKRKDGSRRFYRKIEVRDAGVWGLIDEYSDFLHACPI